MIKNDLELQGTRERIAFFYGILMQMRVTTEPGEYPFMAGSYLAEIEKMNGENRKNSERATYPTTRVRMGSPLAFSCDSASEGGGWQAVLLMAGGRLAEWAWSTSRARMAVGAAR